MPSSANFLVAPLGSDAHHAAVGRGYGDGFERAVESGLGGRLRSRDLDVGKLQRQLEADGAYLGRIR